MKLTRGDIENALLGLAVGDALGVPVEFKDRSYLKKNPVTDMFGYGTHNQPAGTWSDDSSLAFCLADSLRKGINLEDIGKHFVKWYKYGHWTPHGKVFDIGGTTRNAIWRLQQGVAPESAGGALEDENGNGSLMRILPLAFVLIDTPVGERFEMVTKVSALTHAHIRSVLACFIYTEYALALLRERDKEIAYAQMQETVNSFLSERDFAFAEVKRFDRVLKNPISQYYEAEIYSSGYVLHTLEASLWCLLTSKDYAATVLKAVNLGEDTDTTGAVAGGLAGILYGSGQIPTEWLEKLARKADIVKLAHQLEQSLQ